MLDASLLQQTAKIATEALVKVDLHMEQCAAANLEVAASIQRLHQRMDGRIAANRVTMVAVLLAAGSGVIQVILHFWK